jgi:hypothetical protein
MKESTPTNYQEKLFSLTKPPQSTQYNTYNIHTSKDLQVPQVLLSDIFLLELGTRVQTFNPYIIKSNSRNNIQSFFISSSSTQISPDEDNSIQTISEPTNFNPQTNASSADVNILN